MEAGPVPDSEFPFFVPSDLLHASRRRVRFFVSGGLPPSRRFVPCGLPRNGRRVFFCHRRAVFPLPGRVEAAGSVVGRGGRRGVAQARFEGR